MTGRQIFMVEPFSLVRSAFRTMLEGDLGYEVVGEAPDGADLQRRLRACPCDILLLDLNAPGSGGLEMLQRLSRLPLAPRIVALSAHAAPPLPLQALANGASAYLTKQCTPGELGQALARVLEGGRYIASDVAQEVALAESGLAESGKESLRMRDLSARELSVLMLVTEGCDRAEISHRLGLSPKTVSTYRARIIKKLGARSDVDLVRMSLRHGLTVA